MSTRFMVVALLALTVLGGAFYLYVTWTGDGFEPEVTAVEKSDTLAQEAIRAKVSASKVQLVQGGEGKLFWKLTADSALYDSEGGPIRLTAPVVDYYGENGTMEGDPMRVSARHGSVNQESGGIVLLGDVNGTYKDFSLSARAMDYAKEGAQVVFTGGVRMERPGLSLVSDKVSVDMKSKRLTAQGSVRAEMAGEHLPKEFTGADQPGRPTDE